MTDSHEQALGRAQARLRAARAEYQRVVAGTDVTDARAVRHLVELKLEMHRAESEVNSAERVLERERAQRRAVSLGM